MKGYHQNNLTQQRNAPIYTNNSYHRQMRCINRIFIFVLNTWSEDHGPRQKEPMWSSCHFWHVRTSLLELATYNLPSEFRLCCHVLLVTWSEPVILAQVGCDSFSYKLKKSSRKKPIWWAKKYITMAKLQMGTPNERWHQGTGRTYQDREHAGTGGLGAHGTLRRPELHLLFPFLHHRPHFSVEYDI